MTASEIVATSISGVALALSLVSLYMSAFRKSVKLAACLASCNTRKSSDDQYVTYEFALSNSGNQTLMVRCVEVSVVGPSPVSVVPVVESEDFPRILEPGAVDLVMVPLPKLFLANLAAQSLLVQCEFHVYDPSAKLRIAKKAVVPYSDSDPGGWESGDWVPFGMGKVVK